MIDVGLILFLGWKRFIVDFKTCESPIERKKTGGDVFRTLLFGDNRFVMIFYISRHLEGGLFTISWEFSCGEPPIELAVCLWVFLLLMSAFQKNTKYIYMYIPA